MTTKIIRISSRRILRLLDATVNSIKSVIAWHEEALCAFNPWRLDWMRQNPTVKVILFGIVEFSIVLGCGLRADEVRSIEPEERELIPKIWVPDPAWATRQQNDLGTWYDPSSDPYLLVPFELFSTVASWQFKDGSHRVGDEAAVRVLKDDSSLLIEDQEFRERVAQILKSDIPVMKNKKYAEQKLTCLKDAGEVASKAISIHIRVDNADQIVGGQSTILVSKRYLNVDGRFFYIGMRCDIGEKPSHAIKSKAFIEKREHEISNNVYACAIRNESLLKKWEGEIRRCTWNHRLAENGGNVAAATKVLAQELLEDMAKRAATPSRPSLKEGTDRARRLMAERGYNSTNRPSREVFNEILAEAGLINAKRDAAKSRSDSVIRARNRKKGTWGYLKSPWMIVGILFLLTIITTLLRKRSNAVKSDIGRFRALQEKVDRCLLTDGALRKVVTRRMLEEWALIIRFFSPGDGVRRLCVPAVLFLWERIFEPEMTHSDIMELDRRLKSACGLDEMFSRRSFESVAAGSIRKSEYEPAWRNWLQLRDYAYSISDRIAGDANLEPSDGFGAAVFRLLKSWDGKFDDIVMLPIEWKSFFKAHPEFAEHELLVRYGVLDTEEQRSPAGRTPEPLHPPRAKVEDGSLAFLDAGTDGVVRAMLWKAQQKVVVDAISCRLYLPDGWSTEPEIEMRSPHDRVAKFAGPRSHEWLTVERLHLSPEHVQDDLGDWVDIPRKMFGRLLLSPHRSKAEGVAEHREISIGRLGRRDALYMKYLNADDMAAFVGTIEIEGRLHRLFVVVLRRGADSWKFEYAFPAADGVTKESLAFQTEEIAAAARIFVPIETFGKMCCSICGDKMDEPADANEAGNVYVWMKDFFLFDDLKISKASVGIPCCQICREKLLCYGVSKSRLAEIPAVQDQIAKGASILEVKCGKDTVALL